MPDDDEIDLAEALAGVIGQVERVQRGQVPVRAVCEGILQQIEDLQFRAAVGVVGGRRGACACGLNGSIRLIGRVFCPRSCLVIVSDSALKAKRRRGRSLAAAGAAVVGADAGDQNGQTSGTRPTG